VTTPREYAWSSAEAHLAGEDRWRIADMRFWSESGGAERWRELLSDGDDEAGTKSLRRATYSGQPFGDEGMKSLSKRYEWSERTPGPADITRWHFPRSGPWPLRRIRLDQTAPNCSEPASRSLTRRHDCSRTKMQWDVPVSPYAHPWRSLIAQMQRSMATSEPILLLALLAAHRPAFAFA